MSLDQLLAIADPARDLPADATDPESPRAEALLTRIVAQEPAPRSTAHRPDHSRTLRRALVGGALAGAAATVVLAAPMPWDSDTSGPVARAYAVTRSGDAVRVTVHWRDLTDPAALQAALDRAGARVRIFVQSATECPAPRNTVGYSPRAVQWTVPRDDTQDSGFVVRPGAFPANGTFVVSVTVAPAGTTGGSTFAPSQPQIEQISSYMVVGAVPTCAP